MRTAARIIVFVSVAISMSAQAAEPVVVGNGVAVEDRDPAIVQADVLAYGEAGPAQHDYDHS